MNILVIHELDYSDDKTSVIGVADSVEKANKLIDEYYGEFKQISYTDIRDSNLEYDKVIDVFDVEYERTYTYKLSLEWFTLNEL
jgi:hypothetical protein